MQGHTHYIPAAGYHWLTPLYDLGQRWLMREGTIKPRLVGLAEIGEGHRVLDLGCGTGTLAIQIKRRYPGCHVVGIDVDPRILGIAAGKARRAGARIDLARGSATALPYPSDGFDRVVTSLVFHHLGNEDKRRALEEARRVLRPGGVLLLADLGKPHAPAMLLASVAAGWFEETRAHVAGELPSLLRQAGFGEVRERAQFATVFGTIAVYEGRRPPADESG
jgi:ubiquinone/menaquinone biosynthesis C-methylase UbiE